MSLKSFLTRLILICVLPLVMLAAYLAIDRVRSLQIQRDQEASNQARNFATALDHNLAARIIALQVLARSTAAGDPQRLSELYQEAQALQKELNSHILLANLSKQMIFNTRAPLGTTLPDLPQVKGHSSASKAMATGKPAVSDTFLGPVSKTPLVSIAVPVMRTQRMTHLLLSVIETSQFQRRLDEVAIPPGWSMAVLDGKGDLIAGRGPAVRPEASPAAGQDDDRIVIRLTNSPWSVVLQVHRDSYRSPILTAAAALAASVLGATIVSFLGGMMASARLSRAVTSLVEPFPGSFPQTEITEIETVRRSLDSAMTARQAAESTLRRSEERLRRAEEMAHLGNWRYDLISKTITWSDEMYRIFGLNRTEGLFGPTIAEIGRSCHPDDLEQCLRSFDPAGQENSGALEYRIIRPSGEERQVISRGTVDLDQKGTPLALFGTIQDTTALKLKERELQEKNSEMERFTYMISHDLKSPLITVKTFLAYLEQDMKRSDQERISKDLAFMHTATDRMERMLDELLELSRVGRILNPPQSCTFKELAESARSMVAGRIAERGVEVQVADVNLALYGDCPRLQEIWQNLVENACKFMGDQAHPRIEIGVELSGRETVFFVRDNGVGIEPQYQERIFGLFEKLDRNCEGTGLGLALVRRIVELNGGRIRVESQGRGSGSCFRFTLPGALKLEAIDGYVVDDTATI